MRVCVNTSYRAMYGSGTIISAHSLCIHTSMDGKESLSAATVSTENCRNLFAIRALIYLLFFFFLIFRLIWFFRLHFWWVVVTAMAAADAMASMRYNYLHWTSLKWKKTIFSMFRIRHLDDEDAFTYLFHWYACVTQEGKTSVQ